MSTKTPESQSPDSPFYTPAQLAAYLKLSDDSLQKMRLSGTGPPWVQLVPRRYLYRKIDVEEWLAKRRKRVATKIHRRKKNGD